MRTLPAVAGGGKPAGRRACGRAEPAIAIHMVRPDNAAVLSRYFARKFNSSAEEDSEEPEDDLRRRRSGPRGAAAPGPGRFRRFRKIFYAGE
jgi:hypothetical protein